MHVVLRTLGRAICFVLVMVGTLAVFALGIVVITARGSDERLGALALLAGALIVLAGSVLGLRTKPPRDACASLAEVRARLGAGEPVVLQSRGARRMWAFIICASLAGFGVVAILVAPSVLAGAGAVAFAALMLVASVQLLPGRGSLRIAQEGLTVCTPLRTHRWAWNDIEHFQTYEMHQQYTSSTHVGFDRRELTPERQGFWRTVSRGMSGVDETLPDTYGLGHDDLAQLLNDAREQYATEHGTSASERADRLLEAQAALVRQDRVPAVTALLAAVCVAIFVSEAHRYGAFPDPPDLLAAGGTSHDALVAGRWWTLLSANVVHANAVHLALNLVALALAGTLLERELGWARFGAICLLGGVAAMGLAVLIQPGGVVVGASGVIFAIAGAALLRDTHRTRLLGAVAWSIVPIGVVYTFLMPRVSIGGHVGGLLAGLGLGYVLERRAAPEPRPLPGL